METELSLIWLKINFLCEVLFLCSFSRISLSIKFLEEYNKCLLLAVITHSFWNRSLWANITVYLEVRLISQQKNKLNLKKIKILAQLNEAIILDIKYRQKVKPKVLQFLKNGLVIAFNKWLMKNSTEEQHDQHDQEHGDIFSHLSTKKGYLYK